MNAEDTKAPEQGTQGGFIQEDALATEPQQQSVKRPSSQSNKRVKVYRLDAKSWDDLGTGWCEISESAPASQSDSSQQSDPADGPWIIVYSEKPTSEPKAKKAKLDDDAPSSDELEHQEIWVSNIRTVMQLSEAMEGGNFQRQQGTLIVWTESDGTDMALSFANVQGCAQVWAYLNHVQSVYFPDLVLVDEAAQQTVEDDGDVSDQGRSAKKRNAMSPANGDSAQRSPSPTSSSPPRRSSAGLGLSTSSSASALLPDPTLDNLVEVETGLRWYSRTIQGRDRVSAWIVWADYIKSLAEVFCMAEDLEMLESLHSLCVIMQGILLLNDHSIFEYVLQDDVFFGVVGMLEYDPEYPTMKANHREHLSDPARFHQVVPIRDAATLTKIHQTFRLQYLKDVVLARIIDDPTFSMLNSFIFFHQVDIVTHLQSDEKFLSELFSIFEEPSPSTHVPQDIIGPVLPTQQPEEREGDAAKSDQQHAALLLLQQFCSLARNLQIAARNKFYREMCERGLLRVLERALVRTTLTNPLEAAQTAEEKQTIKEREQEIRIATIDILMMIIDHNPTGVRAYCLQKSQTQINGSDKEPESRSLVLFLIDLLITEPDLGIQAQMAEAIKVLVSTGGEPTTAAVVEAARMRTEDPETEKFLHYFYGNEEDTCVYVLFGTLLDLPDPKTIPSGVIELSPSKEALCAHLCDLLCYFVATHTFRSKYFVLTSNICLRIPRLFHTGRKHISLAGLRFYKACLQRKDDFYNRHLIKHDLFLPLFTLLASEYKTSSDNMVISAVLDLIEFLRFQNFKAIINHIMDKHGDVVRELAKQDETCQLLIVRWEQNNEPPAPTEAAETQTASRSDAWNRETKTLEAEEESYFNDSSSDEEVGPPPPSTDDTNSRKRATPDSEEPSGQPARKRTRLDSSTPPTASDTSSVGIVSSPPASGGMTRSPALVFQEMAIKGAQGLKRSRLSQAQKSEIKTEVKRLVDYGDEEEEAQQTVVNGHSDRHPESPLEAARQRPTTPMPLSPPPTTTSLSVPEGETIPSQLGSPFHKVAVLSMSAAESESESELESGPPPSLKALSEKRRREEEDEDVLLSKAKSSGKKGQKPSDAATQKSGGGLSSKLKINLSKAFGNGHGK